MTKGLIIALLTAPVIGWLLAPHLPLWAIGLLAFLWGALVEWVTRDRR